MLTTPGGWLLLVAVLAPFVGVLAGLAIAAVAARVFPVLPLEPAIHWMALVVLMVICLGLFFTGLWVWSLLI